METKKRIEKEITDCANFLCISENDSAQNTIRVRDIGRAKINMHGDKELVL